MKTAYFFKKLAVFLLVVAILDFATGKTLRHFYFTEKSGAHYRLTRLLTKVDQDLLIFGSSRATHHYATQILEKEWGPSFCNVGRDGQGIHFHLALLRTILKRHPPKIIILDMNYSDFDQNRESYDYLADLLPYYATHAELRDIILLRSKFEKVKLLSQIYPFNSAILTIVAGNLETNKKRTGDDDGYFPLYRKWNEPLKDKVFQSGKFDDAKVKAYEDFISESTRAGVKVYVVISPHYVKLTPDDPFFTLARAIAQKYGAKLYDFSQEPLFIKHPELFSDPSHLNDTGAKVFSKIIISQIKNSQGSQ